jgi:hypothetical protein
MTQFVADAVTVSLDLTVRSDGAAPSIGIYWETLWAHPKDAALLQICRRIEAAGWTGRPERWRGLSSWIRDRESDMARSLSLKLVVLPDARPALKAYVSNFDELGAFCEWKNPRKRDPIQPS